MYNCLNRLSLSSNVTKRKRTCMQTRVGVLNDKLLQSYIISFSGIIVSRLYNVSIVILVLKYSF